MHQFKFEHDFDCDAKDYWDVFFDEEYNAEFSSPFVWKGDPQRWGIQYTQEF